MAEFRYIPKDEVDKRHRAAQRAAAPPRPGAKKAPEVSEPASQRNVEQVLAIGSVRYITFRDRPYCIPPVPFKTGQRVLTLYTRVLSLARKVALTGKADAMDEFYEMNALLARAMWSHVRPVGKVRKFLWHAGLSRNPFLRASEGELKAVTDFFLRARMMSSVRSTSETEAQA